MESLGFGIALSAFLTAALIYVADLYADDFDDDEETLGLCDYLGRAIYDYAREAMKRSRSWPALTTQRASSR